MEALYNPFYGRISRGQWWLYQAVIWGLFFAGLFVTILLFASPDSPNEHRNFGEILGISATIFVGLYSNFSTCLNRLRDSGRSWVWYIGFLLPTVGTGLMIYFCGIETSAGRFTRPPDQKKPNANSNTSDASTHHQRPRTPNRQVGFGRRGLANSR
ncbi:DUF805 domain-containing protein [Labrenzia sp. PHM005]|uniref:DUF805 domain-containing protein n=1 Tax=Labrenzia sp. PHM005 TaxID=2590016 RepID=UPI00113FD85A|nr:DUF805 domain-containing protein [Labrenzia sp. PHM005]QDG76679.1 DUF805 domain-containing protein [Labrenzia sp. PHM005]